LSLIKSEKPNASNLHSNANQPFVQQTLLQRGQNENQKGNPFGAEPFVRQTVFGQAKLDTPRSNDKYETEADTVADKVVSGTKNSNGKLNGGAQAPINSIQHTTNGAQDTIQQSPNEDEFKVYKEHRLTLYQREIDAMPTETKEQQNAKKKKEKEKQKFEEKATNFETGTTEKGSWDATNFKEKRDKKFGEDYQSTIDSKKKEVKADISGIIASIGTSITSAITLMGDAILLANKNTGTAQTLLMDAEKALKTANTGKLMADSFTSGADETRLLNEYADIIKKYETLISNINTNITDIAADKGTFEAMIIELNGQKTILAQLDVKAKGEEDVVKLISIQDSDLKLLKTSIDQSVSKSNGTKAKTAPINDAGTKTTIKDLEKRADQQLQDPAVIKGVDKLKESELFERIQKATTDYERQYLIDQLLRRFPRIPVLAVLVHDAIYDIPVDAELVMVNLQKLKSEDETSKFKDIYKSKYASSVEDDLRAKLAGKDRQLALELIKISEVVGQTDLLAKLPAKPAEFTALALKINGALTSMPADPQTIFAALIPFNRNETQLTLLKKEYKKQHGNELQDDLMAKLPDAKQQGYAIYLLNAPAENKERTPQAISHNGTQVDNKETLGGSYKGQKDVEVKGGAQTEQGFYSLDYEGALSSDTHWLQFVARSISYWTTVDAAGNGTGNQIIFSGNLPVTSAAGTMALSTDLANKNYVFITDAPDLKSPFYEGNAAHLRRATENIMLDRPSGVEQAAKNAMKAPTNAKKVSSKIYFVTYLVRDFKPVLEVTIEVEYIYTPTSTPAIPSSVKMTSKDVSALDPTLKAKMDAEYLNKFSYIR